jgi:hypothetical protein
LHGFDAILVGRSTKSAQRPNTQTPTWNLETHLGSSDDRSRLVYASESDLFFPLEQVVLFPNRISLPSQSSNVRIFGTYQSIERFKLLIVRVLCV